MLIFEKRLHFFQYKVLFVGLVNTFMILLSYEMNPFASAVIFWAVLSPYFSRKEKEMSAAIQEAFDNDITLEYYMPQRRKRGSSQVGDDPANNQSQQHTPLPMPTLN